MSNSFYRTIKKTKFKTAICIALILAGSKAYSFDGSDFNNPNINIKDPFNKINQDYTQYLDESDVYYKRGMDFYNANEFTKAIESFEKALYLAPERSVTRVNLAVAYINRGTYFFNTEKKPDAAAKDYRNALYYLKYDQYTPTSDTARENLGIARINLDNAFQALNFDKENKDLRLKTAKSLRGQGEFTASIVEYIAALSENEKDKEIYEALGDVSRVLKNNIKASEYYQKAIELNEKNPKLHLKYANALLDAGEKDTAVKEYNVALQTSHDSQQNEILDTLEGIWINKIKENNNDANAHMNLGVVLQKKGNLDAAYESYKAAERLKPNDITIRLNLGTWYQAKKNYSTAINAYNTILYVKPNHVLAHYYKGTALKDAGKLNEAINEFKFVLEKDPHNELAKEAIFETVKEFPNQNDVLSILKTFAINNPLDPKPQFKYAYQLHSLKRTDEAMEYYSRTLKADPSYTDAYLNIASIQKEKNNIQNAILTLEGALKVMPDNKKINDMLTLIKSEAATKNYQSALQKHTNGQYEEAIQEYKRIIDISEPNTDLYVNLGAAYQALKQHDQAINAYKEATKIDDSNSTAYYYLGTAYLGKEEYEVALKSFLKASAIDPENENIKKAIESSKKLLTDKTLEKGIKEYEQGQYKQALLTLNTALISSPENADIYFQRGLVQDALKKYPLAIGDYNLAIKYNPDLTIAYYTLAVDFDLMKNYSEAKKMYQAFINKSENNEDEYVKYAKQRVLQL